MTNLSEQESGEPRNRDEIRLNQSIAPRLRAQLIIYQNRLKAINRDPNLEMLRKDTVCKIAILDKLIRSGQVTLSQAREEVMNDIAIQNTENIRILLRNAFLVISRYNADDNTDLINGALTNDEAENPELN